jgi:hypothetical protein
MAGDTAVRPRESPATVQPVESNWSARLLPTMPLAPMMSARFAIRELVKIEMPVESAGFQPIDRCPRSERVSCESRSIASNKGWLGDTPQKAKPKFDTAPYHNGP